MTHQSPSAVLLSVLATMLMAILACSSEDIPAESAAVRSPTDPVASATIPVPKEDPVVSGVPQEPAPANADELHDYLLAKAEACDRFSFIEVSIGEVRVVTFSDYCAQDCTQSVTFKNTHPTETIKLLFLMTSSISPDQPGWTGQRWWQEVVAPGESVTKNQSNRTPHADGCPWSATDFSLVGAIPTGNECRWVEDDPATSLLPLQEVENQCR